MCMTVGDLVKQLLELNQKNKVVLAFNDMLGSPLKHVDSARYKADSGVQGLIAYESDREALAEETRSPNCFDNLPNVCVLYPKGFYIDPKPFKLTPKEKSVNAQ